MNEYSKSNWIDFIAFILDVGIAFFACFLADVLTFLTNSTIQMGYEFYVIYIFLIIVMMFAYDMYSERNMRRSEMIVNIVILITVSIIGTIVLNILLHLRMMSVLPYVYVFIFSVTFFTVAKMVYLKAISTIKGKQRILIIDSVYSRSRLVRKIKYSCTDLQSAWYLLINDGEDDEIKRAIKEMEKCDCIFLSPALDKKATKKLMNNAILTGKYIYQIPTLDKVGAVGGKIVQFGDTPAVFINSLGLTREQKVLKRIMDIALSLTGAIVALPIMIVCAIAIKIDSPGPIFYKQERYTIHRKKFVLRKFRTMKQDAEKFGAQLATEDDPRITRVGKILRITRLDELPQVFNILMGSMSVVGPRPERPIFADEFEQTVDYYKTRYFVKAGLTGYAQVYGKYNTRASDKILMDLVYITQYSFWLDIKLILLTIKVMFTKESTEGVNEEKDEILNTDEKEFERIMAERRKHE